MPAGTEVISFWGIREPFSMLSHFSGALLAVIGLVLLVHRALAHDLSWRACIVFAVYAVSLVIAFSASALFHYFPWSAEDLVPLKKLDHAAIFIFIAGTCTVLLHAGCSHRRRELIAGCWLISMAALALKMIYWPMSLWMSALVYLTVGWTAAASVLHALRHVAWDELRLLIFGMAVYTLAAVVFATEAPVVWPGVIEGHELFHLMTLAGAAAHFQFIHRHCTVPASLQPNATRQAAGRLNLAADPQGS